MNAKTFTSACSALLPLIALLTRLALAIVFIKSGFTKWEDPAFYIDYFSKLHIPAPAANTYLVASVELVGGIALVFGAGTRIAALLLSGTMVVAIITVHWPDILDWVQFGKTSFTDTVALPILLLLLWLLAWGPGPLSVDHALAKKSTSKSKGK